MREVTLSIPESRWNAFTAYAQAHGLRINEEINIPEAHKALVRQRISEAQPETTIAWEEARKQFRFAL